MSKARLKAILGRVLLPKPIITLILASPFPVAAFTGGIVPAACRLGSTQTCTLCHFGILVINFTSFLMENIAFPATVLLVAISGIVIITAGPSETRQTLGKTILTNTVIGILIVMLAWLGVDTIIKILTGNISTTSTAKFYGIPSNFGPWNEINPDGCPL